MCFLFLWILSLLWPHDCPSRMMQKSLLPSTLQYSWTQNMHVALVPVYCWWCSRLRISMILARAFLVLARPHRHSPTGPMWSNSMAGPALVVLRMTGHTSAKPFREFWGTKFIPHRSWMVHSTPAGHTVRLRVEREIGHGAGALFIRVQGEVSGILWVQWVLPNLLWT